MDFVTFRGGPCLPECLPVCEGCKETTRARHTPYADRVAGEFNRGNFTLGWRFHPGEIEYQERGIVCAPNGLQVGDFVSLIMVPAEHTLFDLFVKIVPEHTQYATSRSMPNTSHRKNNMEGFEISVAIKLFSKTGVAVTETGPTIPPDLLNLVTPPKPTGNGVQLNAVRRAAMMPSSGGFFVPQGQYAEVGFTIVALPSNNPYGTGPFPMELISGYVELAGKVGDYQTPLHG